MHDKYWLIIDPHVHMEKVKHWFILYNTLSGVLLEYNRKPILSSVISRLMKPASMRTVLISRDQLRDKDLSGFVEKVREYYMGDIINIKLSKRRPRQMLPVLKIQKDLGVLEKDPMRSIGEEVLKYITEMSVYIGGYCSLNCRYCRLMFKQIKYCRKFINTEYMQRSVLEKVLNSSTASNLSVINFMGDGVFNYKYYHDLMEMLKSHAAKKNVYIHYRLMFQNLSKAADIGRNAFSIKLLFDFPLDVAHIPETINFLSEKGIPYSSMFTVMSEDEYQMATDLVHRFRLADPVYLPVFNGENHKFIEGIYITREELKDALSPMKEILSRGKINLLNFGRIEITPDGSVFTGSMRHRLGNIMETPLVKLISKELKEGKSWLRSRINVVPCRSCVFKRLCPPVSNLNDVMRRNNLCDIMGNTVQKT